jgi:NADPH:quinone reductase-like Zn-dependent oxidoreductase
LSAPPGETPQEIAPVKAYVASALNDLNSLTIKDAPAPGPLQRGQIRVGMRAASLNYRDLLLLFGAYPSIPDLIPCSDGTGEVIEVGPEVWRVKPGDRVALTFNPDWIAGPWQPSPAGPGRGGAVQGVMCEQLVVDQHEAVLLPSHLSFEEGATLPCAGVTAWNALCGAAPLLPGMTVLLQGGGGVSVFALQFAKLFGARVIIISSSPERCARLKALGADETIDYRALPEWSAAVRELTGGVGVDLTVELGGAKTMEQSLASTRSGGRLAVVGLLSGRPETGSLLASMPHVDITRVMCGSRLDFETMNRAIAFHKLRPVIDSRYRFEQLPDALRHLQSGRHLGKIVIGFDER